MSNVSIFFLPSSGLLSFHFWKSCWQKLSLSSAKTFLCQALERGVRSWKNKSVLSCAASLTCNFFLLRLCFYSLRPCWPTFLLSTCPTSVFLLWKFSCVSAKMCVSVCSASVLWLWGRF